MLTEPYICGYEVSDTSTALLLAVPPEIRTINVKFGKLHSNAEKQCYTLPFPALLYRIVIYTVWEYSYISQVWALPNGYSPDARLSRAPLLNTNKVGDVCIGNVDTGDINGTIIQILGRNLDAFWYSEFNLDMPNNPSELTKGSLDRWEQTQTYPIPLFINSFYGGTVPGVRSFFNITPCQIAVTDPCLQVTPEALHRNRISAFGKNATHDD